jgi:hypothetical protein
MRVSMKSRRVSAGANIGESGAADKPLDAAKFQPSLRRVS